MTLELACGLLRGLIDWRQLDSPIIPDKHGLVYVSRVTPEIDCACRRGPSRYETEAPQAKTRFYS